MALAPGSLGEARAGNVPGWRIILDGVDLAPRIDPRLLSINLSQKRDSEADELRVELHDHDGKLAIPTKGAMLSMSIGWTRGIDVSVGLVDMGRFKVDEVEHRGPPDMISIVARSADLTGDYRIRRDASYVGKTVGEIVGDVARREQLTAAVAPELASIILPVQAQSRKSDMALIRELGRRFDAVATVKSGHLIFSPIGRGTSVGDVGFGTVLLTRRDGDSHRYSAVDRDRYQGVSASWHDQDGAERQSVHAGGSTKAKRLKRTFANEADARHAADAEWKRIQRGAAEFEYELALGRADLKPEQRVTLSGWKPEIDAPAWLIAEVTHRLDGQSGFRTSIKLETAP